MASGHHPTDELTTLRRRIDDLQRQYDELAARRDAAAEPPPAPGFSDAERLLRRVADSLPVLISYIDAEQRYRFANLTYERWFGIPREQVYGRTLREVVGDDAWATLRPHVDAVLQGIPQHFEEHVHYRVAGERWINVSYEPDSDGVRVRGFFVLVDDVTEARRTRDQLRDREQKLLYTYQQAPVGVAETDLAGTLTHVNRAFCHLVGHTEEELIGRNVRDLIWPDDVLPDFELAGQLNRGERTSYNLQKRYRHRDGDAVWVDFTGSVVRDPAGRPVGRIGIAQDISARRSSEEALHREGERLTLALEAAQMGTWEWNIASGRVEWSHELQALSGFVEGAFPKDYSSAMGTVHPDDYAAVEASLQRSLTDNVPYEAEYRVVGPDGTTRWILGKGKVVRDASGTPTHVRGVAMDVTRGKLTERALSESDARLRSLFRLAAVGMAMTTVPGGRFVAVNEKMAEITGYSVEELTGGMTYIDVTHPDDRDASIDAFKQLREGGVPSYAIEKRYLRRDGGVVWVQSTVSLVRDPEGRPTHTIAVIEDISSRRQSADALRASEERQRLAVDAGNIGLWDWDITSNHVVWSDRIYEFHGLRRGMFGGTLEEFVAMVHPSDRQRVGDALERSLTADEPYDIEFRTIHRDGQVLWLSTKARVIRDASGRPVRMLGATTDISASKEAELEIQRARRQVENILASIRESFIALDREWRFTYVNEQAAARTGLPREQVIGRAFAECFPDLWTPPVQRNFERCAGDGIGVQFECADRGSQIEVHAYPTEEGMCAYMLDVTERKKMEAAERQHLRLLESSNEPTILWDLTGAITYWNRGAERLYGWTAEEAVGRHVHELLQTSPPLVMADTVRSLEQCGAWIGELVHRTRDGRPVVVESREELIRDPDQPPMVLQIDRDITERKRAEESLRRSQAQLERTASQFELANTAMRSLIYDWDPESDRVERLRGFQELTGFRVDEVPATAAWWHERVHPDDLKNARGRTVEFVAGHEIHVAEYRVRQRSGDYIWVRDAAAVVRDELGRQRVVGCTVDISEQKRAERALQEREEFYRTLGEAVSDFIWSADTSGRLTYVNRRWQEYTGYSAEQLNQAGWGSVCHPDELPELARRWQEGTRTGEPFEAEMRYRRFDGQYRWFMVRAVAVRHADGSIVQWVGTSTDVHRLKVAEATLRRYNDQLEQFAYAAAHDLQEPLRTVSIYVQMLERALDGRLEGPVRHHMSVVKDSAGRMAALVHDLLMYTKVADGGRSGASRADSSDMVRQVLANLKSGLHESKAEIELGELPVVGMQEAHVIQLLQNLVSNAIKYRSPGVPLRLSIGADPLGGGWTFTVRDNGIGIHPDYHDRIFGLFKRLHGRSVSGTGIGLAICKRIVEHYGGRIWVESDGVSGTSFRFTVPDATASELRS